MFCNKKYLRIFSKLCQVLLVTIILFLISSFSFYSAKKEVILYPLLQFDEGVKYHKEGKLKNAVVSLNHGLSINPIDLPILIELGQVFSELSKFELAISTLSSALKVSPQDPLIHLLLGNAYLKSNKLNEAIEEYEFVAKLEPENILLLSNLGIACLINSDYQCAIDNLGKAVLAYPYFLKARLALAVSYHFLKNYSPSRDNYRFILKYMPSDYIVWYNLSKTEIASQNYESALEAINNAISLNSSLSELYLDRAYLNYKLSKNTDAENDYLEAIKQDPVNPVCLIEYASFLWKIGSHLKAAETFDKAINLELDNKNLRVYKAYLLQLSLKYDEAIKSWQEVLDDENNNKVALFNLAKLYHQIGNYSKEIELYQKLLTGLESEDEIKEIKHALACAFHKNKDFNKAHTFYNEILIVMPNNPRLLFNYGVLLNNEGSYKEAATYLEKAIDNGFEKESLVYKELVSSYLNLNDSDKLRNIYKSWLNVDVNNYDARIDYANFLAMIGEVRESVNQYRLAVSLKGDINGKYKLAKFLLERKDIYGAVAELTDYLKQVPNDLKALILLANAYKDLGVYEEAINTYKKIISIQYDNYLAYYNLGVLFQMQEKFQEAQNYLLKSLELNEKYSPAYYALGLSFIGNNDFDKAKDVFQKYLQIDPKGEYRVKVEARLKEISKEDLKNEENKA